jgi:hypothetical protein
MRAHISLPVVFTAFVFTGCAQVTNQISSTDAAAVYAKCALDRRRHGRGRQIKRRQATVTAGPRGADPGARPIGAQCRQIVSQDKRYAAWQSPPWQEYFQRGDAIFYKLSTGEIPVGLANKLAIESRGKISSRGVERACRRCPSRRSAAAAGCRGNAPSEYADSTPSLVLSRTGATP